MKDTITIALYMVGLLPILLNMVLLHTELSRHVNLRIDIEKTPPTKEKIRNTRKLLAHKLKRKRNILICLFIIYNGTVLYTLLKIEAPTTTTLIITIATMFLTFPINLHISKIAVRKSLAIFQPMPKEYSSNLLNWCRREKVCDQYRIAVATQGRYITLAEFNNISIWMGKSREREDKERDEEQYRTLHENKPIATQR